MRNLLLFICAFVVGCAGGAPDGHEYPERPDDTPYFYNETSMTEMNLSTRAALRNAREETGIEFVTVLLESIPGHIYIGDYAAGLFDGWRIGSRTGGRGVLILFVEEDRTLKIEVSYDLEPILTDAYCNSFQPTVKSYYAGRYFGDVFDGIVISMMRRVVLEITDDEDASLIQPMTDPQVLKASEVFLSGGGGITDDDYYYEENAKLAFIVPLPPERIDQFDADQDARVVVERYLRSLREGINYPFLGMLTEGSQMKRLEYPESPHFYMQRWKDCRQGFPYEIVAQGDLAAVRFDKDTSFPIFLRRSTDGYWKVDAARAWVSSWQDFSGNRSGPVHRDHPWMFAFPEHKPKASLCRVPDPVPLSMSLIEEIKRLEKAIRDEPGKASNYFDLADVFYWDCMWIAAAIDLVEKGLELEPGNIPYRWLAIRMRYRFPSPEPNAMHFEMLLEYDPENVDALCRYSYHCWQMTMEHRKAVDLLERAAHAEWKARGTLSQCKQYLEYYKQKYWSQVAVDMNRLEAALGYIRIFHWP